MKLMDAPVSLSGIVNVSSITRRLTISHGGLYSISAAEASAPVRLIQGTLLVKSPPRSRP